MNLWKIIVLGAVQGLTEFLPISSSGHLVIGQHLLGMDEPGVSLEIILHLGTLLAVFAFYYDRIAELFLPLFRNPRRYHKTREFKTAIALLIGSVPAGLVGIFLDEQIEAIFGNPQMTSGLLIVTGGILLLPKLVNRGNKPVGIFRGFLIGCGQALAILPGISRSGSTISVARLMGVDGEKAAEFSFLLSIPAILGATVLKLPDSGGIPLNYLAGGAVAALVGYGAIVLVVKLLNKGKLHIFSYWCFLLGLLGLIFIH